MSITQSPNKRKGVRIEIVRDVKPYVTAGYVKVTTWRLTTKDHTGQVVYVMSQLAWSLGEPIVYANPSVVEFVLKMF
jgi:hypothetical protein